MIEDPVCKMMVDEKKTPFKSTYDQKEYFFCSEQCKEDFDSKPQLYLAGGVLRPGELPEDVPGKEVPEG
jgi:YHS domain-containing protein